MSHSFVNQAEKLLAEMRRRWAERALERYVPSSKQEEFHLSSAPIRLFVAANGCGKTTCMVAETIAHALGYQPWNNEVVSTPPQRCLIVGRDFTHSLQDDIDDKLTGSKRLLPEGAIHSRERLANGKVHKFNLKNGSSIKLMSYEQDPMAFEGSDWDFVGLNEPPPKSIWAGVSRGRAKAGGKIVLAMTPIGAESAWIYDDIFLKGGTGHIDIINATLEDSFMSDEEKEVFKATIDPDEYEARVHGRFRFLMGRIYKQFQPDIHVLTGPRKHEILSMVADPKIPKGMVMDPHDRKPFFLAWFLITPANEMVFFHEWPEGRWQDLKRCDWAVPDYVQYINSFEERRGFTPVWRVADPNSAVKRSVITDETICDVFIKNGVYFVTDIPDDLADGHLAVKDRLRWDDTKQFGVDNKPTLFILDECQNLYDGFLKYAWDDRTRDFGRTLKEKPSEYMKDPMDCVRYACVLGCNYFNPLDIVVNPQARPGYRGYV